MTCSGISASRIDPTCPQPLSAQRQQPACLSGDLTFRSPGAGSQVARSLPWRLPRSIRLRWPLFPKPRSGPRPRGKTAICRVSGTDVIAAAVCTVREIAVKVSAAPDIAVLTGTLLAGCIRAVKASVVTGRRSSRLWVFCIMVKKQARVGERRWPMAAAVLLAGALRLFLPTQLRLTTRGRDSGAAGPMVALIAGDPGRIDRQATWLRVLTAVLIGVITVANAGSSIRLVYAVIKTEPFTNNPNILLVSGAVIWPRT